MTALVLLVSAALAAGAKPAEAPAANAWEARWHALLDDHDFIKAKATCGGWLSDAQALVQAEGHKCLASVSMADQEFDQAVSHMDAAAKLEPGDLSIFDGRLQILVASRRFAQLPATLEASIADYEGKDGLDAWLDTSAELLDQERYAEGIAYTQVLVKHYPKDHRVLANMGAFLAASGKKAEALPYMKQAAELAPGDALDNWNLGRLYDERGKVELADKHYKRSLSAEKDAEQLKEYSCLYAEFLKKNKRPGAAAYEKKHCPEGGPDDD